MYPLQTVESLVQCQTVESLAESSPCILCTVESLVQCSPCRLWSHQFSVPLAHCGVINSMFPLQTGPEHRPAPRALHRRLPACRGAVRPGLAAFHGGDRPRQAVGARRRRRADPEGVDRGELPLHHQDRLPHRRLRQRPHAGRSGSGESSISVW